MSNLKLSDNFMLSEFIRSKMALERGLMNYPEPEDIHRLIDLCENVLEKIRKFYGKPLEITSGYRCKELNKAVKGAKDSQHMKGEACDFIIRGLSNYVVCKAIVALRDQGKIEFDQIILESSWIHISYRAGFNRNEVLTRTKSGYIGGLEDIY